MDFVRKHPVPTVIGVLVLIALIGSSLNQKDETSTSTASETQTNISVDTADSHCTATGVDDIYTGNGHITFYIRLNNDGAQAGSATVVPVRYYSDGDVNQSAMDMVTSDEIAAGGTTWFRTPAFEYKAHEHALVSCAVDVDGTETEIRMS